MHWYMLLVQDQGQSEDKAVYGCVISTTCGESATWMYLPSLMFPSQFLAPLDV
jgi:hypothetical protein